MTQARKMFLSGMGFSFCIYSLFQEVQNNWINGWVTVPLALFIGAAFLSSLWKAENEEQTSKQDGPRDS